MTRRLCKRLGANDVLEVEQATAGAQEERDHGTPPGVPDPNISFRDERGQIAPEPSDGPVSLGASIPVGSPR